MDRSKVIPLLISILALASLGSGLLYQVEIGETLNHTAFRIDYRNTTKDIQRISATFRNIGSIGCTYRLKADVETGNSTTTYYSGDYPLWPGETRLMELRFIPQNISGKVETQLYITYCGKQEKLDEFSFNDTSETLLNKTLESRTLTASEQKARIKLGVRNASLIPVKVPPYWKVSSAEVRKGLANLSYQAPIFNDRENIRYAVVNTTTDQVIGVTEVNLNPEKTLMEKIMERALEIALLISLLLNALLATAAVRERRK
ncbi:MAG: hypothetical protein ABEJ36_01430 [Candidatus Nanosalina sp.]